MICMVDTEPIDHVMRKIKKKYDTDQENWNVIGNADKDGNREMFISAATEYLLAQNETN